MDVQFELPLVAWSAWAPHLENEAAWKSWSSSPDLPSGEDVPDVKFLPALFRRRLSRLSRIALRVAHDCLQARVGEPCRTVFASRYGEQQVSLELLMAIVHREALSPTQFSFSVHNTASGLFSIATGNQQPTTALAGMQDTFFYALLEAAGQLHQDPTQPVLVVMVEEPLPEIYQVYADEVQAPHGLALLLDPRLPEATLSVSMHRNPEPNRPEPLPAALGFLAWWLQGGATPMEWKTPALSWSLRSPAATSLP